MLELIQNAISVVLHLDVHLNQGVALLGTWMYAVLFVVVFCETGLVVTPFLPGDSLLFAVGALAATEGSILSFPVLAITLLLAGVLGDATNYSLGKYFGPRVFQDKGSRFLNQDHLRRTQLFYEKHGGKTIILARFLPIVRTFAPFVAGISRMQYRRFFVYNVVGALVWVLSFLFLGHAFGNLPSVKRNFHFVILAILVISVAPVVIEYLRARIAPARGSDA